MTDEEALTKAFGVLRDSVDLAFTRWKATGHIDDSVRELLDFPVYPRRTGYANFAEAIADQGNDSVVMRAICRRYLGEPGKPWNYECVISMGGSHVLHVKGYNGVTKGNVRDMRDRRGLWAAEPKFDPETDNDSGFGF